MQGDPCEGYYEVLDDVTRHEDWEDSRSYCDQDGHADESPDWQGGNKWYLFVRMDTLLAMPMEPVQADKDKCATTYPGWVNGTIPPSSDQYGGIWTTVNATVCFSTEFSDCAFAEDIQIRNCAGNYLLYYLPSVVGCDRRYCSFDPNCYAFPCW